MMDTIRFAHYCMRQCNSLISEYERHHKNMSTDRAFICYRSAMANLKIAKREFEDFLELVNNINAGGV